MTQPNFLIIFPDQQRFDHIGAYGLGGQTPNVDRIADAGCTFQRAYTPCPLCSPARAAMMIGRFPHAVGVPTNTCERFPGPDDGEVMASQLLSRAGYACGYSGKWHISRGPVRPWGFADVVGNPNAYGQWCRREGVRQADLSAGTPQRFQLADTSDRIGTYSTPVPAPAPCGAGQDYDPFVARQALRLARTYAAGEAPFAVWCCFHGPHPPLVIPEPYYSMYRLEEIPQPANFVDPPRPVEGRGQSHGPHAGDLSSWQGAANPINTRFLDWDWPQWQQAAAVYRGYVRLLDDAVGLLLDGLDELGVLDSTVVIYATDHGEMLGNHRLWQKMNMYEESVHIPLIVRPPAPGRARAADDLVGLADVAPTILDYAGIDPPANLHGASLRRIVEGGRGTREAVFSEWNPHNLRPCNLRMVRTDRYKYVWYPEGRDSLYDLRADPHEIDDLADDGACRHVLREHRRRLDEWMRQTDDPLAGKLEVP